MPHTGSFTVPAEASLSLQQHDLSVPASCFDMISTCNRFAMLEGVAMGMRNGLDLSVMTDVLNSGGARSKASENMLPALGAGVPDSFFFLNLMLKDLNLATALASDTGVPLQFGQMARGMLQAASNRFGPQANLFDIGDYVADEAGTSFSIGSAADLDYGKATGYFSDVPDGSSRMEIEVRDAADDSLLATVSCAVQAGKTYDAIITHKGFADPDMAMFCQQVEGS